MCAAESGVNVNNCETEYKDTDHTEHTIPFSGGLQMSARGDHAIASLPCALKWQLFQRWQNASEFSLSSDQLATFSAMYFWIRAIRPDIRDAVSIITDHYDPMHMIRHDDILPQHAWS